MRSSRRGIRQDSGAQWLLLSAIVVSIGLGSLILLFNMATLSGHSSTSSAMNFPKSQIRDLRQLTTTEAIAIGREVNENSSVIDKLHDFNESYDRFIGEVGNAYKMHGTMSDISYAPSYNDSLMKITNVTLNILFYDGTTYYTENTTVGVA
jgi:hypothetical protein